VAQTCPRGLKTGGKRLWTAVTATWELERHEVELLTQACRTVDRLDRLEAAGRDAPLTIDGRANPVLVESRQQSIALARLLAALRLPDEAEVRPQRRTGARGVYMVGGGNARGRRPA
jgi:hypothetical protein